MSLRQPFSSFPVLLFPLTLALTAALPSPSPATEAKGPVIIKMATVAPEDTPWADGLIKYRDEAKKRTEGRLEVSLYLGGRLGDENEACLLVKRGQLQSAAVSIGALASQVPELEVIELPYLFLNYEEADKVLEGELKPIIEKLFLDRGLVLAFWSENGFRCFGNKNGFIKKPEDLKGRKMRVQESAPHIAMYRAFGASPVPIPVTEVLTSLQTGVVDGFDNTPLFSVAASWHTAIKYYTVSEHIYQPAAIVFNKDFYDTISAKDRETLTKLASEIGPPLKGQIRDLNPILLDGLKEAGVQVYQLTPEEKKPFEALARKAQKEFIQKASPEAKKIYQIIVSSLKKIRGEE